MVNKRRGSSEPLDPIAGITVKKQHLQQAYKDVSTKFAAVRRELDYEVTNKTTAAGPKISNEQIRSKANKLANMMESEIMKQMKWQPSCKTKGKRWTYSAMVPNAEVFFKLFNLGEEKKAWKQKKIPLEQFESVTGELRTSIRYGYLVVTSKDVTVHWNREELSFSVSGLYGLA
ncbi:hypothetical protein MMC18_008335 [Xylographa bjoerkii]|nr:hypothetical protein [Xylographa bjoerkii]